MAEKRIQNSKMTLLSWWILSSVLGFALGIGLCLLAPEALGEIASSIAFGVVAGLSQWLVLRKRFQRSGWWILATSLGATLGFAAITVIQNAFLGVGVLLLVGVLGFAAFGLVVGIAQWWVLRRYLRRAGWWVLASFASWSLGGFVSWALRLQHVEFITIVADFAILGFCVGAGTGLALILLDKETKLLEDRSANLLSNIALTGCALILVVIASAREISNRNPEIDSIPDVGTPPLCSDLPSLVCIGDDAYCAEVVLFEPITGTGYINYPVNDETWDNQYRSYIGRDLMMAIKYVSAKVACETEDWYYKQLKPLGLGDMSEEDGSIPGTSTGHPDHPWGTHQNGRDIDVAYFLRDSQSPWLKLENRWQGIEGDLLRPVCKYTRFGMNVYHCTGSPQLLDPWRTALFIAHLTEHSQLRVIGVDGQIGPILESALDELVQAGWIDSNLREMIPLAYEVENEGMGWFKFHYHHMHISLNSR